MLAKEEEHNQTRTPSARPSAIDSYEQDDNKAAGAQPSGGGAERARLLVGKQHVGTPCGILAPGRSARSENNPLGGQIPVFLSGVFEPGIKNSQTHRLSLANGRRLSPSSLGLCAHPAFFGHRL